MFGLIKKIFGRKRNDELREAISQGAMLIDVRSPGEYKTGSAPAAINIPVNQLTSELAKLKKQSKVVVFCRSGNRSSMAKKILEQNGFQHVINGGTLGDVLDVTG